MSQHNATGGMADQRATEAIPAGDSEQVAHANRLVKRAVALRSQGDELIKVLKCDNLALAFKAAALALESAGQGAEAANAYNMAAEVYTALGQHDRVAEARRSANAALSAVR